MMKPDQLGDGTKPELNQLSIPQNARALLVWRNDDHSIGSQPVPRDCAVLNIERDLRDHMNVHPLSDEWFLQLRAYIDQRLAARQEARARGGFSVPIDGGSKWGMGGFEEVA